MRRHAAGRLVVLVLVVVAVLAGSAPPASAFLSSYRLEYDSGRIRVQRNVFLFQNFDTPGAPVGSCTAWNTITGTVESTGGTDTVDGVLSISAPFSTVGGDYLLTASGASSGTNRGNWSGGTSGTFGSLSFPGTTFNIRTLDTTTCLPGSRVCGSAANPSTSDGSLNLTVTGGTYNGATLALSVGEQVFVNATGAFTNAGCVITSPLQALIVSGAAITIGDNPNDDVAPAGVDPGAILTQLF